MIEELYVDAFTNVTVDRGAGIVVYRRNAAAYPSLVDLRASFDALRAAVAARHVAGLALLIDAREAPGRNDPEFEDLLGKYRVALFAPFRKHAVLLKTAVGVLQTARLEQSNTLGPARAFHDEKAARAYLVAPGQDEKPR